MTDSVKPEQMAPEKMDGGSLDIAEQRRGELKQLLPGVFTETTDSDGQPIEAIDFERLKAELGTYSDVYEGRRERYGMEWPGKRDCMRLIQQPSRATLKPCREESVDFDTTQNLFIEGDNLEVLKLLQKSYYGKVKMIYIDPPYNTGKEFIYKDDFSDSLKSYLSYAGLLDAHGKKVVANAASEGRFHTNWLNMMYPRLYLARNLLREDGAIFISIDDNELVNLRRICDEIFGEENFIATIIWHKMDSPKNSAKYLSEDHDYVVLYAKNADVWRPNLLPRSKKMIERYQNPDDDPRGPWLLGDLAARNYYSKGLYAITTPSGKIIDGPPAGSYWRISREKFEELDADGRIWWGESGQNRPGVKKFLSEVREGVIPQTYWNWKDVGSTRNAKQELSKLMQAKSGDELFVTPKPVGLIERMLQIATDTDKRDIVMDFFAGSGSTMHAVFRKNAGDGGNRSCISVQLPESSGDSEAISNMAKERIKRAAEAELGGRNDLDSGIKVFKLDKSNLSGWSVRSGDISEGDLERQLQLHVDHIQSGSSQEDIVYELLLKSGFPPNAVVEKIKVAEKEVFSVAEGALLVCLEDSLSSELIDAVADLEPMQFVCMDRGFDGNDQLKANAVQTFKARSQGAETEMVFKVV